MAKIGRKDVRGKENHEAAVVVHKYLQFIKWLLRSVVAVSNSKWVQWSLLILLPLIIIIYNHDSGNDYDVWWHMALGKYYWTHHTLRVNHAIFSWTPADSGWIYNTSLGSLILYLAYTAFSGFGLWLVQCTMMVGIFALTVVYIRSQGGRLDTTNIGLIFLFYFALGAVSAIYRPELFSMFFFALFVFLYFKGRSSSHQWYWLYPLLMVLWVNLHGAFIFGIVLLGLLCTGEFIEQVFIRFDPPGKKQLLTLIGATALTCAACIINPYGPDYLLHIFQNMTNIEYQHENAWIQAYVKLWPFLAGRGLSTRLSISAFIMVGFGVLIVILYIRSYVRRQPIDVAPLIACVPIFFVGMNMGRACYFFLILALFTLIHLLGRADVQKIRRRLAPLALALFLILTGWCCIIMYRFPQLNHWFGKNITQFIPVEEAEIIKKYRLPAPIFNDYLTGGYMMWALYPDYKVFIDPRFGPYVKTVNHDYFGFSALHVDEETISNFTEKYPFKVAFLKMDEENIIFSLLKSKGNHWRLCYFGKNAVILIHDSLRDKLSPELRNTSMMPERFSNEDDPDILKKLFLFYFRISPAYGKTILEIFDTNVSPRFIGKKQYEVMMIKMLMGMSAPVKNNMLPQQPPGAIQKPLNSRSLNEQSDISNLLRNMFPPQAPGAIE